MLGAIAAKEWKFPEKLVSSIRYHHGFTKKAGCMEDLVLLMISNYIDHNKSKILNSGIEIEKVHPEISQILKKPLLQISYWLPELLNRIENEFKNFAENFK